MSHGRVSMRVFMNYVNYVASNKTVHMATYDRRDIRICVLTDRIVEMWSYKRGVLNAHYVLCAGC